MDVRLSKADLATVDQLVEQRGAHSRSQLLRALIREAADQPEPPRLTRDDVLRELERKVLDGSVPAARAWLAEHDRSETDADPFSAFDELLARHAERRQRLGA